MKMISNNNSKDATDMHKYDAKTKTSGPNKAKLSDMFFKLTSDLYVVGLKVKGFHWNIVGEGFFPIHVLLDEQVGTLLGFADGSAELVRQINKGVAPISMKAMIDASSIKEETLDNLITTEELMPIIMKDYKSLITSCQHINMMADKANRQDLSDFVITVRQFLDKYIWQFDSYIEEE